MAMIDSTVTPEKVHYYVNDHHGQPQQTFTLDANGDVTGTTELSSDAFGGTYGVYTTGVVQPHRQLGHYADPESGYNYNMNRVRDPSTTYIESDPIGLDGGINTFAYTMNNPVMGVDPLGLMGFGGRPTLPGKVSSRGAPITTYYGGELHFFLGGGLTSVTCKDKCGKEKTFRYMKFCSGAAAGFSGGGGAVANMNGNECNRDTYKGWFFEVGGAYGYGGGGVDIGYNSDGPFGLLPGSLSGVYEGGLGGGLGVQGKATWCYYVPLN